MYKRQFIIAIAQVIRFMALRSAIHGSKFTAWSSDRLFANRELN